MSKRQWKVSPWMIATAGVGLLLVFILVKYGFWYASNDDYIRSAILSGAYSGTPGGYTVCMSYVLGEILAAFYKLIPGIPWCGVFFLFVQFYALWLCCKKVAGYFEHPGARVLSNIGLVFFFFGFLSYEYVYVQFTMVAAVAADASIFLFLLAENRDVGRIRRRELIQALLLYTLAILIRMDVALLHLPFLGLAVLYKIIWKNKERESRKTLLLPMIAITGVMLLGILIRNVWVELVCVVLWGVILLLWIIHNWKVVKEIFLEACIFLGLLAMVFLGNQFLNSQMYQTPQWDEFRAFDEQRVQIIDYSQLPNYDTYKEVYDKYGVSREEYILIVQSGFALSDKLNAGTLSGILADTEVWRSSSIMDLKRGILNSIRRFWVNPSYPSDIVLIIVALAAGVIVLLTKDWASVLLLQLVLYGHIVCWTYLYWSNRMPARVTKGIYLAEIMLLLGICFAKAPAIQLKRKKAISYLGFAVTMVFSVTLSVYNINQLENTHEYFLNRNKEWDACKAYCRENNGQFFFLDTPTFAGLSYVENIFDPNRNELQNYDLSGSWITNSPIYFDKLESFNISGSVSEHMSNGGMIHFIGSVAYEETFVRDYFARDGYDVLLEKVDTISVGSQEIYTVFKVTLEPAEEMPESEQETTEPSQEAQKSYEVRHDGTFVSAGS